MMRSTKSADLTDHIKFLLWQLHGFRVTRPFLSANGLACKTLGSQ